MPDLIDLVTARQALPRLASVSDDEINRLISEASGLITDYCRNNFGAATYTEVYDSSGGSLFLNQRPITGITSIAIGPPDFATTLDATSYRFDPATGEVRYGGSGGYFYGSWGDWLPFWGACGWQSVQVAYGAGGDIPATVSGRCLAILNRVAAGLATNPAYKSKTVGNLQFVYGDAMQFMTLTDDDRRALSRYRIYSL